MKKQLSKFCLVAIIVLIAVGLDQWTKSWAENHLANPRYPDHTITAIVDSTQPVSVESFIQTQYPKNSADENRLILANVYKDGTRLMPQTQVNQGDTLELRYVSLTVIDGNYDYMYARNPGAAFSFLADQSPEFRAVFFNVTGLIAVILMLVFIGFSAWKNQKLLIITLSCILGGAIGNIIDRIRLGYVIDFISWHAQWGGQQHYWPTFNIADIFVTCGVVFLCIDMLIHGKDKKAIASNEKTEYQIQDDVPSGENDEKIDKTSKITG